MSFRGFALWPPIWIDNQGTREAQGKIGVLRNVRNSPFNGRRIFLMIEHEGAQYIGTFVMEYELLGEYMTKFFKDCIGMTLESIGSLDVP